MTEFTDKQQAIIRYCALKNNYQEMRWIKTYNKSLWRDNFNFWLKGAEQWMRLGFLDRNGNTSDRIVSLRELKDLAPLIKSWKEGLSS